MRCASLLLYQEDSLAERCSANNPIHRTGALSLSDIWVVNSCAAAAWPLRAVLFPLDQGELKNGNCKEGSGQEGRSGT
jgi:hypothetical protein